MKKAQSKEADTSCPKRGKKRKRTTGSVKEDQGSDSLEAVVAAYMHVDGYSLARDEKTRQRAEGIFFDGIQYGEIQPASFVSALSWCNPQAGETFIDLGSGCGKAVLTAAASYEFSSVTGVELLRPLHDAAEAALQRMQQQENGRNALKTANIELICADVFAHDWTGADIVYVMMTCFTDEMVERICKGAEKLRKGSRVLVTSRSLESTLLQQLQRKQLPCGKGAMTFIAYERV
eukprot:gnl/MRDRNA2_/MRDRNA2_144704_c0_seq1.p1 gnl/MRDRNA2_/MRDRNA2_144704_c0~~gnl/MRDRNA2_/MRDRNA2_144704_c0_seq1.p1  ORF type:complete len:234 (-),score=55.44 gnl/MRDRNA2_/MRDRNA2_144704_c0_seq1:144-845(-)